MSQMLLIGNCSQLLVVSSDNGKPLRGKKQKDLLTIPNGSIMIQDGKILDFGLEEDLKRKYSSYQYFDGNQCLLMPAFVDPHTHLVFSGTREDEFLMRIRGESYIDILKKGYGIHSTVLSTKKESEQTLYELAKNNIQQMQKYGTVGLEIKSGYGLDTETEKKILIVIDMLSKTIPVPIRITLLAGHAVPKEYMNNRKAYIDLLCNEMIPSLAYLANYIDVFCEEGVFSVEESNLILQKGLEYGLKPKLHVDEFKAIGGLTLANKVDAVSVDHLIVSKLEEIRNLRNGHTIGVVLPGTSFSMESIDEMYARRLIDMDIPVAIGTDFNPGTCMCYSMQAMIELAVLKMSLSIEEAVNAATINASFACGIEKETGSIEIGKRADLLLLQVDRYQKIPYFWGVNKVAKVFISGQVVDFTKC